MRTVSLNSHYLVLFKNPRDKLQIRNLTTQMHPSNAKFLVQETGRLARVGTVHVATYSTNVPAPGVRELLMHLKRLGVPKSAFSSKFAHSVYGQGGAGRRKTLLLRVY
jgi:hypothetical protein